MRARTGSNSGALFVSRLPLHTMLSRGAVGSSVAAISCAWVQWKWASIACAVSFKVCLLMSALILRKLRESTASPFKMPLRLVLDTNIWLDWLVFDDPGMARIKATVESGQAEIFINTACEQELERVL